MISEWMNVMLEEISRKKAEAEQARIEEERRARHREAMREHRQEEARARAP